MHTEIQLQTGNLMARLTDDERRVANEAWENALAKFRSRYPDAERQTPREFAEHRFYTATAELHRAGIVITQFTNYLKQYSYYLLLDEHRIFNLYSQSKEV